MSKPLIFAMALAGSLWNISSYTSRDFRFDTSGYVLYVRYSTVSTPKLVRDVWSNPHFVNYDCSSAVGVLSCEATPKCAVGSYMYSRDLLT